MRTLQQKVHLLFQPHTLYCSYRWLTWLVAGLCVVVFDIGADASNLLLGVLLTLAVVTIVATALAQSYVRFARRRPWVLLVDLLFSLALLWVTGDNGLLFLPYALGALILPALLLDWRRAVVAALLFAVNNGVWYLTLSPEPVAVERLALYILAPCLVVSFWLALPHLLPPLRHLFDAYPAEMPQRFAFQQSGSRAQQGTHTSTRRSLSMIDTSSLPGQRSTGIVSSLATLTDREWTSSHNPEPHVADEPPPRAEPPYYRRNSLPTLTADLATQLHQMVETFGRDNRQVSFQVVCSGELQQLSLAQQLLLTRLVDITLHNIKQHAYAQTARLTLHCEARQATLVVWDDGVGLMDGTHRRPGVHSLQLITYCLAELGGALDVREHDSGGVEVRASLPLTQV